MPSKIPKTASGMEVYNRLGVRPTTAEELVSDMLDIDEVSYRIEIDEDDRSILVVPVTGLDYLKEMNIANYESICKKFSMGLHVEAGETILKIC